MALDALIFRGVRPVNTSLDSFAVLKSECNAKNEAIHVVTG